MTSASPDPITTIRQAVANFYAALAVRVEKESTIMATIADLAAADAALAAEVAAIKTSVDALIAAYEAAINNPATHLDTADQAALDAAVADMQAQTANLSSEQASVDTANPPTPPAV